MGRICDLPDEILDRIVFFLDLKEAVGTSILSKRWRYLWNPTMTLKFDLEDCLGLKYLNSRADIFTYVDRVDSAVTQNRGSKLEQISVRFDLTNQKYVCYSDACIGFAMKQRVGMLEVVRLVKIDKKCHHQMKRIIYSSQDLNPMYFRKHLNHLLSKHAPLPPC